MKVFVITQYSYSDESDTSVESVWRSEREAEAEIARLEKELGRNSPTYVVQEHQLRGEPPF